MKSITGLLLIISLAACNSQNSQTAGLEGKSMPSFNLFLSDSATHLNTMNIPTGHPIALFFFGPYCPYSRAEMEDILTNMKVLKNIHFYLLTTAQYPDMMKFYNYYQLNKYPNVTVAIDYTDFFAPYFKAPGVPYIAVYDTKKKLKEVLIGKSDLNDLRKIATE